MRNTFVLFVLMASANIALAQDSLQVQPSPALPQGQYGTPGQSQEKKEDRVAIQVSEIPSEMKATLDANEKFKGWEKGQVYFDRSADQYIVHIVEKNATRTYRFNKTGEELMTNDSGAEETGNGE